MGHQFKPGDLALIIGAFNVPTNVGATCELVEYLGIEAISSWADPSDGMRIQNGAGMPGWLVIGEQLTSYCGSAGWVVVAEHHLMPLRGDFAPERQKTREAEPCA